MNLSKKIRRILNAFVYSWDGFKVVLKEPAFVEEFGLLCAVIIALFFLKFTFVWSALIICVHLFIMIVEILNTSIEAVVDLTSPEKHPLAKVAKDLGSLAVLLSFFVAVIVWTCAIYNCN